MNANALNGPPRYSARDTGQEPPLHHRLHKRLAKPPDVGRQLDTTLQDIGTHFGFTRLALYLVDNDRLHLSLHATYGLTRDGEWKPDDVIEGHKNELEQVLRTGEPARWKYSVTDVEPSGETPAVCSMLALPLTVQDQILGVLIAREHESTEPEKTDESILTCLSSLLADILQQSLILDRSQWRVEQLSVLNEIARTMSANMQVGDLLETIYLQVGRVIDTSTYFVSLWDKESDALTLEILYDEGVRYPKLSVPAGEGLSGWVIQNRKPLRLDDLEVDVSQLGITPNKAGKGDPSRSWLGVPMTRGDRIIGVLAVASYTKHAFSADDEELLTSVAAQAAIAIENAHLYEQARFQLAEIRDTQEQMISMSRLATSAELAAGLGHEINNALTPILGVTQLALRRTDLDDELQSDLEQVFASAQRIRHIVRTFSEVAMGFTLPSQKKNINTILLDALELFEWRFESHDISVGLRLTEGLNDVACDVLQLRQAIANILLNALEAMPEGGSLEISSYAEDGKICTCISDTGTGIQQDDLDRVFDPWFTTKVEDGRARGLGLGLFAAYNVVKAHGGEIEVESKVDQGTSFLIRLPQVPQNQSSQYIP